MRKIHLVLELTIDDRDRVIVDKLSYEVRGKHEAPIVAEQITPTEVQVEQVATEQQPNFSQSSKQEVLALLLSLGFDVSESQKFIDSKTVARIKEVVRWVKMKKGVVSPTKLATKLLENS